MIDYLTLNLTLEVKPQHEPGFNPNLTHTLTSNLTLNHEPHLTHHHNPTEHHKITKMKMMTRNSPNLSLKNINVEYTPKKTDLNVKVQRRFLNFNVTSNKPILHISPLSW